MEVKDAYEKIVDTLESCGQKLLIPSADVDAVGQLLANSLVTQVIGAAESLERYRRVPHFLHHSRPIKKGSAVSNREHEHRLFVVVGPLLERVATLTSQPGARPERQTRLREI